MVASTFHLLLAASTALLYDRAKALHVKTLHAELIYALAPSCNISEAFRVFGAGKGDTKVGRLWFVVCIVCCCVCGTRGKTVGRGVKSNRLHLTAPQSRD